MNAFFDQAPCWPMLHGMRVVVVVGLCLFALALQSQGDDPTCSAAGLARAGFRHRDAIRWLNSENAIRAPYYIAQAKRMYEKGVRQEKGIDKSNNDPFIALYDAQNQVLAALDLGANNASVWLGASQATAMIASLSENAQENAGQALQMLAKASAMDVSKLDEFLAWAKKKVEGDEKRFRKMKKQLGKTAAAWKAAGSIPEVQLDDFLPLIKRRLSDESCEQGAAMPPAVNSNSVENDPNQQIKAALSSITVRPLFPTLITSVNVIQHFGSSFAKKLADVAVAKYRAFSAARKKEGMLDPNDINDRFFNSQSHWPELHRLKEYKQLQDFLLAALIAHAEKTGYPLSEKDKAGAHISMWAAVYLEDGGRHGYHVHQGSLSSCVFYAKAPPGKTPIMFIDPRGAPPIHDYEQHLGERDFEPMAPFHHNYHFFAEAGDLVCFPSWLVHRVPSHFEHEARVAFPANLQADKYWDTWYRSSTLG